jgi:hypothetical protein
VPHPTTSPGRRTRVLPGLEVLLRYERTWLRADVAAGLTVGAMLIPQSMAYADLAGLALVGYTDNVLVFPTIQGAVRAFRQRDASGS